MILLNETHRKLLWLWLSATALLLVLVLIQYFNGLYRGIENTLWQWVGICLLPSWILLLTTMMFKPNPKKIVLESIYWVILVVTATYFLLLFLTWYGMRAGAAGQGLESYFKQTYRWLLPLQALVLVFYGLLFLKKNNTSHTIKSTLDSQIIPDLEIDCKTNDSNRQQAHRFLSESEHENLFLFLHEELSKTNLAAYKQNDLILLETQFNQINRQKMQGVLDPIKANIELNRINQGLLDLINRTWTQT